MKYSFVNQPHMGGIVPETQFCGSSRACLSIMAAVVEELAEPQYIGATVGATLVVGADEQLVKL